MANAHKTGASMPHIIPILRSVSFITAGQYVKRAVQHSQDRDSGMNSPTMSNSPHTSGYYSQWMLHRQRLGHYRMKSAMPAEP